ncbi:MAG: stage II sporulation protein M [Gammaproteobacteria bacterium]|nr:stage II sporulation protein M [Gammaproteobacteria bacterium]
MRQEQFEQEHAELWQALEEQLADLEQPRFKRIQKRMGGPEFPSRYRRVCTHYSLALSRAYSPALQERLHSLVLRGHPHLYRQQTAWRWRILHFVLLGFPRALRRHSSYFWVSLAVFLLPALLVGVGCYQDRDLIYSILDEQTVASMETMYDPANRQPGRAPERSSETDFVMFGYYIMNNIGIGFRAFAGGILLGVGTLFLLLFNGVVLGGVAGHLTRLGYQDTFWPFVSGHGAFELTAIVICGAAGLMLGHALLAPGQRTRLMALKQQAAAALQLVMGAALMLLLAAFIEAFWSSSSLPIGAKYSVAALLWLLVVLYLGWMGRSNRGSH